MRLFVACTIPEPIKAELAAVAAGCRNLRGLKWVDSVNLHATLKFLGEVDGAIVPQIGTALDLVAGNIAPFHVEIAGVGCFPGTQNPRVLWAAIRAGGTQMAVLATRVDEALHRVGFSREARPFSPHITLARVGDGEKPLGLGEVMKRFESRVFGNYAAMDFHLVKSELRREGPVYTHISRFTLGAGESV